MQFPMTRAQLQTYHNDVPDMLRQKTIEFAVELICNEVESIVIRKYPKNQEGKPTVSKCVVQLKDFNKKCSHFIMPKIKACYSPLVNVILSHIPAILPDILVELRKKFVDCSILTDPLQTYIVIDWS